MPRQYMPRCNTNRSRLPQKRSYLPELGARHPLVFDDKLEDFFVIADLALEEAVYKNNTSNKKRRNPEYRLYDVPARTGVTILERRISRQYADKNRIKWSANDDGRIRKEIRDELGRLSIPNEWPMKVEFSTALRVGNADEEHSRKIALIVDQQSHIAEFLVREHEITMDGLGKAFSALRYPYNDFIPKFTVAALNRRLPNEIKTEALAEISNLLPITAYIEPLRFTSRQDF